MRGLTKIVAGKSKAGAVMALVMSRAQKIKNDEKGQVKKGFKR